MHNRAKPKDKTMQIWNLDKIQNGENNIIFKDPVKCLSLENYFKLLEARLFSFSD